MSTAGTTYIVEAIGTDCFKIGFTKGDVEARIKSLQTGCPVSLELVRTFEGVHAEKRMHKIYDYHRVLGEWFYFPKDGNIDPYEDVVP